MTAPGWSSSSVEGDGSDRVAVHAPSEETGGMWLLRAGNGGPEQAYTQQEWDAFTAGVRAGEFDLDVLDARRV